MSNKQLPQLDAARWSAIIVALKQARAEARQLDKAARDAKARADLARAQLFQAMDGNPSMACGSVLLTIRDGASVPGAITLHTGMKIPLDKIDGLAIGDGVIPMHEVKTLFGGRVSGPDIDIAGEI